MKIHYYLTITALYLSSTLIYSQKIGKLDEIKEQTFAVTSSQSPTILAYKTLVTFPYRQDNAKAGAKDEYFTIRAESLIRLKVNKADSIHKFLGLSKTFESGIKINSIKYYYKNGKSVGTRKIKESDLSISTNENGVYIDYSQIVQDSSAILDISYKSDSKSKQIMQFYLDNRINYVDFNLQIFIPEIYSYNITTPDQCIKFEIKEDLQGPMIGYDPGTGPNKELLSQVLVDVFKKEFNSNFKQVYCNINLFTFTMTGACSMTNDPYKEIVNLKLNRIAEIK